MKKPIYYFWIFFFLYWLSLLSLSAQTNLIRINAGGPAQNYNGEVWTADQYFVGGQVYSNTKAIANTTQDQIYQSERFGNISYRIPALPGKYKINLHFAEIWFTASNERIFNVSVESQIVRTNIDLVALYGSATAGTMIADNVQVTDGFIDIVFTTLKDNAKVSGISIDKYPDDPLPPTDSIPCEICQTLVGPAGPKGDTGLTGPQGATGAQGPAGICPSCPPSGGSGVLQSQINARDYGVKCDGLNDDTEELQAAINATIAIDGKLIIPPSATGIGCKITNTLQIVPADGQTFIDIESWGHHGWQLNYSGPSNQPAVQIIGLKGGVIQGLRVRLMSGVSNSACFEIGTRLGGESTAGFTFINCDAELGDGVNNAGWRLGKVHQGDHADISQIMWVGCSAWGGGENKPANISGHIGWDVVGSNTLQLTWSGGGGNFCDKLVRCQAGGSMFFFGLGGSHNNIDFHLNSNNNFFIQGGRFEVGKTFLKCDNADGGISFHLSTVELGDYAPPNGRVFDIDRASSIIIDGLRMEGGNAKGAQTFYLGGYLGVGTFIVRGGAFHNVSDPFYTVNTPGKWRVSIQDVGKRGNSIHYSDSYFTNKP